MSSETIPASTRGRITIDGTSLGTATQNEGVEVSSGARVTAAFAAAWRSS